MYTKDLEEVLHQNPWWTYKHETYTSQKGIQGDYFYGETPGSGCSMIVALTTEKKLLLVRQYRYLRDKNSIEFPCGGLLNADEQPEEAVRRELIEETGYVAGEIAKIGVFDGLNGLFKDTLHLFICSDVVQKGDMKPEETEEIELLLRRPDEFDDMVRRGEIWDGQTLAAWAMAREKIYQLLG